MTERHFNLHNDWVGRVVNLQDPDMEGKVQVRIFGIHDDTTNIPDSDLLWAKPFQDITSAAQNKMGKMPVGLVVGSIVGGYFLDADRQHPIMTHSLAKAGDLQSNTIASETNNGQAQLQTGTNSTPLGGRISNNAFQTRNNKKSPITSLDAQKTPSEDNDSAGVDVTANALANTHYANNPTTASISNPVGSILNQILQIDPQLKNSILPNAVQNFLKIKELDSFSSPQGASGVLGQLLGAAMNAIGAATALSSIVNNILPGQLSSNSVNALLGAIQALGSDPSLSNLSATTQSILGSMLPGFTQAFQQLINSGNLNASTLEFLLEEFQEQIMNQGQQQTLGATSGTIMNSLGALLPQIAPFINSVLDIHLPQSVLNQGAIQQALQAFALNQAFIKSPQTGKKQYAILATTGALLGQIGSIQGVEGDILNAIKGIINPS